jgi:hypothetical protein
MYWSGMNHWCAFFDKKAIGCAIRPKGSHDNANDQCGITQKIEIVSLDRREFVRCSTPRWCGHVRDVTEFACFSVCIGLVWAGIAGPVAGSDNYAGAAWRSDAPRDVLIAMPFNIIIYTLLSYAAMTVVAKLTTVKQ